MKLKLSVSAVSMIVLLACATPPPAPSSFDRTLSDTILQADTVTRFFQRMQARVDAKNPENKLGFGCLEIGRLSGLIGQLITAISREGETFQEQQKDPARDLVFSAYERVTALTGLCGEQSGERIAGFRYMPKLKLGSEKDPVALELARGIATDLTRFKSESGKQR